MPRPLAIVEHAMEAQVRIRALQRATAPLYEAALHAGDFTVLTEAKALAQTLRVAGIQAKRIAGMADGLACPDSLWTTPGHGRAA